MLARNGSRIFLEHIRAGGKILTTAEWVEAFCRGLASADRAYFDAKASDAVRLSPRAADFGTPAQRQKATRVRRSQPTHNVDLGKIAAELEEEGL